MTTVSTVNVSHLRTERINAFVNAVYPHGLTSNAARLSPPPFLRCKDN